MTVREMAQQLSLKPLAGEEGMELSLIHICGGIIKLVDIAAETDGADEFIRQVCPLCQISLAHTAANYEQAKHGFDLGISQVTHMFNAMSGLTHRAPGVVAVSYTHLDVYKRQVVEVTVIYRRVFDSVADFLVEFLEGNHFQFDIIKCLVIQFHHTENVKARGGVKMCIRDSSCPVRQACGGQKDVWRPKQPYPD